MMEVSNIKKANSAEDLRTILFDEIELLRTGKIAPQRARVTANIAKQIIDSMRVQVQYERLLTQSKGELPYLPETELHGNSKG